MVAAVKGSSLGLKAFLALTCLFRYLGSNVAISGHTAIVVELKTLNDLGSAGMRYPVLLILSWRNFHIIFNDSLE